MSEQALSLLDADLSALLGAPLEAPADTLGAGDIVSATVTAANSAGLILSLDSGLAATCAASAASAFWLPSTSMRMVTKRLRKIKLPMRMMPKKKTQ